jgi:CheY-like chemotaxis protein
LLARLAGDFRPQCAAGGIALRVVPTRLAVESDPVLLERILRNLLANAVRYTRTGGIVLGARRRGDMVRIDVVDTGIGIAVADQARVFDEFVQIGATARPAGGRGLGLGLAIVRRLADLLEHRIELASRVSRGSRFSIVVPRTAPQRRRTDGREDEAVRSIADASAMAGRHIVVIDDDPAVVEGMRALFGAWRARVTSGAGADEALRVLIAAGVPAVDLIVADLRLADDACGIAAVAALRRRVGNAVPALIVSGDASDSARKEVRAADMVLLAKPVVAPALLAAASAAIARTTSTLA